MMSTNYVGAVQRSPSGRLTITVYRQSEPAALRAMIELELRGWLVARVVKLGDGTRVIQAESRS